MSIGLNASQARAKSQQDLIMYNEVQTIMKTIITDSAAGAFASTVDNGTDMTQSTPVEIVTGSVSNPTVSGSSTLIINGSTITLGTTGLNLNSIIADINDAAVTGVVASKDSTNNLVLTITAQASTTWQYVIGAGTANTALGFTAQTYVIPNPTSVNYFQTWQGTRDDRGESQQMDQIIRHFQNLGYKIERTTNISTNATFQWNIYW